MRDLYDRLTKIMPTGELTVQRDDLAFITMEREQLRPALLHLRDKEGFSHLVLLTAVDWIEDGNFQLTYLLSNRIKAIDVGLRVMIPRENSSMETIHDVWPTAATYQRELREMFGIDFPGSPRVDEEFILEGWTEIPPYRREFDTKEYSEKQFEHRGGRSTNDPADYMKQQQYPDRT